jgi:hypothetical protein
MGLSFGGHNSTCTSHSELLLGAGAGRWMHWGRLEEGGLSQGGGWKMSLGGANVLSMTQGKATSIQV